MELPDVLHRKLSKDILKIKKAGEIVSAFYLSDKIRISPNKTAIDKLWAVSYACKDVLSNKVLRGSPFIVPL